MADNLDGFWSSILIYLDFKAISFFIITIFYSLILLLIPCNKTSWKIFILNIIISYIISLGAVELWRLRYRYGKDVQAINMPHFASSLCPQVRSQMFINDYNRAIPAFSILHLIGWDLVDWIFLPSTSIELTSDDIKKINSFIANNDTNINIYDGKLIIVVFESFEDWAYNEVVTPNLCAFMRSHPHLYAPHICTQVKNGNSMDGQMIINTGLLPTKQGAVPFLFPTNKFPSITNVCYGKKVTLVPHSIQVWNQASMSISMGYDTTLSTISNDSLLLVEAIECIKKDYNTVQIITVASHSPFVDGANCSHLVTESKMPKTMSNYLKAVHYTDECLSSLLDLISKDSMSAHTTLIVTGDHTIFYPELRKEFANYLKNTNLTWDVNTATCPLLIYSDKIKSTIIDTNFFYQMDIFPTVLNILGISHPYWNGFGINVLGDKIRRVSSEEASDLSDKIIRSDYFKRLEKELHNCDK